MKTNTKHLKKTQKLCVRRVRLIGYSKFAVGVTVSVLCQPCDELATHPGCTPLFPNVSWDQLQHPYDPEMDKLFRMIAGWVRSGSATFSPLFQKPHCFNDYLAVIESMKVSWPLLCALMVTSGNNKHVVRFRIRSQFSLK